MPTAIILTKAPAGFTEAASLDADLLVNAIVQSNRTDGLHLGLTDNLQLWLPDRHLDQPLAVIIPLDDDLPLRAASALRLHGRMIAKKVAPITKSQTLTAQQRRRLVQMLRALDGRLSQASYREIASMLFGHGIANEKGWKTHPIRARTIRLVNNAIKMLNRGYLKLLRGHERI